MTSAAPAGGEELRAAIRPLRDAPARAAVLSDLDGTLAPIVPRPDGAAIPPRARAALQALARDYALAGIVSGRRAADARRIVGLDELAYAGNHGLELLPPGAERAGLHPALAGREEDARHFMAGLDSGELEQAGIRVEDKGPIAALHWRGADDIAAAERHAAEIGALARSAGLVPHPGRKVLELRPAVAIDKGDAVEALLDGADIQAALYGGDDRTDADGFAGLRRLSDAGRLEETVCVGVASDETPAEIADSSDLMVAGTEGYLELLEELAR